MRTLSITSVLAMILIMMSCSNKKDDRDIRHALIGQKIGQVEYTSISEFLDSHIEEEHSEGELEEYTISFILKDEVTRRHTFHRVKIVFSNDAIQSTRELNYLLDFPYSSFDEIESDKTYGKAYRGKTKRLHGLGGEIRVVMMEMSKENASVNGYMVFGTEVADLSGVIFRSGLRLS